MPDETITFLGGRLYDVLPSSDGARYAEESYYFFTGCVPSVAGFMELRAFFEERAAADSCKSIIVLGAFDDFAGLPDPSGLARIPSLVFWARARPAVGAERIGISLLEYRYEEPSPPVPSRDCVIGPIVSTEPYYTRFLDQWGRPSRTLGRMAQKR